MHTLLRLSFFSVLLMGGCDRQDSTPPATIETSLPAVQSDAKVTAANRMATMAAPAKQPASPANLLVQYPVSSATPRIGTTTQSPVCSLTAMWHSFRSSWPHLWLCATRMATLTLPIPKQPHSSLRWQHVALSMFSAKRTPERVTGSILLARQRNGGLRSTSLRASALPTICPTDILLKTAQTTNYERVPYAFAFRESSGKLDFVAISVHLKPDKNGKARRKEEFSAIAAWISANDQIEHDFLIVGDMNIEDAAELAEVMPHGFV